MPHSAKYLFLVITFLFLASCTPEVGSAPSPEASETRIIALANTATVVPTKTISPSLTPTLTATPSVQPSATVTLTLSPTATLTPSPVYTILRGEVNVEHVMCFYGPSKAYLYKYGLLGGSNLEILGILPDTGYIQVRAIGGDNPCWMNLEWMNVEGDIAVLQPIDPAGISLPWSPYYAPLASASAIRDGDLVTISWSPLSLRAGDDSEQEPYLVEAWVCRDGRLVFIPFGVYETSLTLTDEEGCDEPSHGRVYGVEKHGYTLPVEIPWP